MIIILTTILYTIHIIAQNCRCLHVIELPTDTDVNKAKEKLEVRASEMYEPYPRFKLTRKQNHRRYWLINEQPGDKAYLKAGTYEDEKDSNLKSKISTLVQQTVHDTERKMKTVHDIKEQFREQLPYRAGFVLSLVKKSRDVLNELFNVAVKHREEWKALEQLKIFELIVHTNVDATNLVRQLVDIHLTYLNASLDAQDVTKKRVILL